MDRADILKGIAAYSTEQEEILDAIDRHGGALTEREFDERFDGVKTMIAPNGDTVCVRSEPKLRMWPYDKHAFILGSMNDPSNWAKFLDLTQLMCRAGLLSATKEDGQIVYRRRREVMAGSA